MIKKGEQLPSAHLFYVYPIETLLQPRPAEAHLHPVSYEVFSFS
ncbi:hypothetical protein QY97_03760 [Bacillus thermotolerans]|nr:hypothetical protein QY97_03760 [Bacillus thermotolerans]